MLWLILACFVLALVFLQRLMLPMLFGAGIGVLVYFAAPMMQFEASAMQILFCGLAGLMLGIIRTFLWLPGSGGKKD